MDTLDYQRQYENIKKSALEATEKMFPIDGKDKVLRATKVWVDDDLDPTDYAGQKDAKLKDKTWGANVRGDFELVDKATGKVVEREKGVRLFMLPKATTRMSFIVGGNEYQVDNQLRRKPGIYTIQSQGGDHDLRTEFNVAGQRLDLVVAPKTGVVRMKSRQGEGIPIYPVLSHLGISDSAMAKAWGEDVLAANKSFRSDRHEQYVRQAAKNMSRTGVMPATATEAAEVIRQRLHDMEVDPKVNAKTIGDDSPRVTPHTLLAAAKNLVDVQFKPEAGKLPIERDSLQYKRLMSVEDFIKERLEQKLPEAKRKFLSKLNLRKDSKIRDVVDLSVLNPTVETFFTQTNLSHGGEQTNPLQVINAITRVTMQGEGGAKASFTITPEARALHPTHLGFIDPVHTPESESIGATLHLSLGARKRGNDVTTPVIDVKTGKHVEVTPQEMSDAVVSFPDQYDQKTRKFKEKEVKVLKGGKHSLVAPSEVQYVLSDPKQAFSVSTNLVPFLHSNSGGRALMAAKMLEQAIPLVEREAPLVQNKIRGTTFERVIGNGFSHRSPVAGTVKSVGKSIVVTDAAGKSHEVHLYDNFPLNGKAFIHSEPTVKAGDKVAQGQVLADTNYTRGGTLAIGTNLRTVYTPYLGKNFEDGVAISESAAKKLSSEHLYPKYFRRQENVFFDRDKYAALFPNVFSREQLGKLDDDGVVRKGQVIDPGDPILAAVRHVEVTAADMARGKASAKALRPERSAEETWNGITQAKVVDVVKGTDGVKVFLKTVEPAQIGDKVTGRYGNKGIIVSIIPDKEAPRIGGEKGQPADVILNPTGIITRMNVGQMLETAASKVAEKGGKPYEVDNFAGGDATKQVKNDLDRHGLTDTEELYDPATNKVLGRVLSGKQYMLKLSKQAGVQFSARSWGEHSSGYDLNRAPIHGGEAGSKALDLLTLYAMLAHGSRANLKEMAVYKSQQNDDFWRAYESGQALPPPKPTFAYNKFLAYLKGAGVNVESHGSKQVLVPMTDKEVEHLSSGPVTEPLFVRRKDLAPEAGGFFDPAVTGGLPDRSGEGGEKWSHIELAEPVPNPIMENPIRTLLGLDKAKFNAIVAGKQFWNEKDGLEATAGLTGGQAIKAMLSKINVDEMLKDATETAKTTKSQAKLDVAHKTIRYLRAVKESGRRPEELYVQSKIPVIPPVFRPLAALPSGDITVEGPNRLYQHVAMLSNELKWQNSVPYITDKVKADLRNDLYKSVGALAGITAPLGFFPDKRKPAGFIELVKGKGQSKEGYYQHEVLRRKQDLVGRGTIIPEPKLGSDEVSIPQEMAWAIFKPFVIRSLVSSRGYSPADAQTAWTDRSPVARSVLEQVMDERPVMLNRAPSLHKFSIMAFKAGMHDDPSVKSIKIPPLIVKGFNADFDGDCNYGMVVVSVCKTEVGAGISQEDIRQGELMAARFKVTAPVRDGNVVKLIHLEDFPHGEYLGSKVGQAGRIDFYAALPGTQVIALNERTGQTEWTDVSHWSKHYDREVETVELSSGREIYTDDDPRGVYGVDPDTLEYVRFRPTEAVARPAFVPRISRATSTEAIDRISPRFASVHERALCLKNPIQLDETFGYLIGAGAGNGWAIHDNGRNHGVGFAAVSDAVQNKFASAVSSIFYGTVPARSEAVNEADRDGYGPSRRTSYGSINFSTNFEEWVGSGARNKHLPTFTFIAAKEFIAGVFAGLMDTDGSISILRGKVRPQLSAMYTTSSLRLAQEVRLVASMLGIGARVAPTKTPAGLDFWYVTFSGPDIQRWNGLGMVNEKKLAALSEAPPLIESTATASLDVVPIPGDLAAALSKIISYKTYQSLYTVLRKATKCKYLSRQSAERVVKLAGEFSHPLWHRWLEILKAQVIWDRVVEVRRGGVQTGYDLTVPGYETFMDVDGVILSNTMAVHVPVLEPAVEEAKRMFPSRNIYNPGTGSLMLEPRQESMLGLSLLSKNPSSSKPKANLKDASEVEVAINRGALKYDDPVVVAGQSTTAGRALINQHLPTTVEPLTFELNKDTAGKLYREIAAKEKDNYANIVDRLRQLGDLHAYRSGFTVTLDDAEPDLPEKDQIFREAHAQVAALRKSGAAQEVVDDTVKKVFQGAEKKVQEVLKSRLKQQGNRFYTMVTTGARGNMSQLKQIVSAPVLVRDHRNDTIPTPVTTSFSKGMPLSDYWVTLYGARAGAMDRQLQTSKPGAFTKDIMAAAVSNLISKDDCGDNRGLTFDIRDKDDLREVNDRFLAQDVTKDGEVLAKRNTVISPKVTADLLKQGVSTINVRSPLTCLQPHGICALDYGLHDDGSKPEVGDNIGAISGQAMSEPLTQLTMSTFHSGSVAGAGLKLSTFDKIDKLMRLQKRLPGKATLADVSGRVDKIEPSGVKSGHNVLIGGVEHFVPKSHPLIVREGSQVKAGDAISEGIVSPQELLDKKRELLPALEYMAKEVTNAYRSENVPLRQRAVETVVRTIGSLTRVVDPGSSSYAPGELAPYQVVANYNQTALGSKPIAEALGHVLAKDHGPVKAGTKVDKGVQKILGNLGITSVKVGPDPIIHEPQIYGVKRLPLMRSDWMSQLGYNHIKDALLEGAASRAESDVHSYHPVPAFAYGAEFGEGQEGAY